MNLFDKTQLAQSTSLTEELKKEMQQQFRENLQYVETFEGIPVYLQPDLTVELDLLDIASGFATKFDVEGNGIEVPIIILSEVAIKSVHRNAILWHEHGHHALNHFDGKTESDRVEAEELEADMWSYLNNGPEVLEWLVQTRKQMKEMYEQFTPTLEYFQQYNMTEYTPEELLQEALDRQNYSLNEMDIRIEALS